MMHRREFLSVMGAAALPGFLSQSTKSAMPYSISLAEWSLHRALLSGEITNLDFPVTARNTFGISAVEYVNTFMRDKSRDAGYVTELKKICTDEGVTSLLIMCDREGRIGQRNVEQLRRDVTRPRARTVDATS